MGAFGPCSSVGCSPIPFAVCLHLQARSLTGWAEGDLWGRSLCLMGCLGTSGVLLPALSLPFTSACGEELSLSNC